MRIAGICDSSAAAIEVNLIPIQGGTAKSDLFQATNGKYADSLWITGGDYRLEVKTIMRYISSSNGATQIYGTSRTVERVGVGEVLLLWGHSFIAGDPSYDEPSSDPRVRTVEVLRNPSIPNEPGKLQDLDALPLVFQPITTSNIGPFGVHISLTGQWWKGTF